MTGPRPPSPGGRMEGGARRRQDNRPTESATGRAGHGAAPGRWPAGGPALRLRRPSTLDEIEVAAARLLQRFAVEFGEVAEPPVPFELVCDFLGLSLEPVPLAQEVPGALGAISFSRRLVLIDEACVPSPRYGFTVCHELGHWELHRGLGLEPRLPLAVAAARGPVDLVCRDGARDRHEREADRFAAALLMPEPLVRAAAAGRDVGDPLVLDELSHRFAASRTALRIRLETLGLLASVPPGQLRLF